MMFFANLAFYYIRFFCLFFLVVSINFFITTNSFAEISNESTTKIYGYIESNQYNPESSSIHIVGWAFNDKIQRNAIDFEIQIDGQPVKSKNFSTTVRNDLVQHFGTPAAQQAGFTLDAETSAPLYPGRHQLSITAKFDNSSSLPLTFLSGQPATFSIQSPSIPRRHWVLAGILTITIGFLLFNFRSNIWERIGIFVSQNQRGLAFSLLGIFVALVSLGITGSSVQLLLGKKGDASTPFLNTESAVQRLLLKPRPIRSDEWRVMAPNALAQVNHHPPFPIINQNIGLEGQNMLIIGMTGVPVWHPSSISRPATWGFFFLPLSQALSWHWFFPIFSCLLALWGLLNLFIPERSGRNLAASALFCLAPYAAGWSHWPLYTVFFPTAAVLLTIQISQLHSKWSIYWRSIVLGVLLAGFALILYPPWQITVASLYATLFLSYIIEQRLKLKFNKHTFAAFAIASLLCTFIIFLWWVDAHDAIQAMRNTVYPGQRAALHGGDQSWLLLFRGNSNLDTLSHLKISKFNESEFSSYMVLIIPLLAFSIFSIYKKSARWTLWSGWLIFVTFLLVFYMLGVPVWFAKAIFWDVVPSLRLDLALGLSCTFALAFVEYQWTAPKSTSIILAGISMLLALAGLIFIPIEFYSSASSLFVGSVVICIFLISYWLLRGHIAQAIALNIAIYILATVSFHPTSIAPKHVFIDKEVEKFIQKSENSSVRNRVLVISDTTAEPMSLFAAGVPVINGTFYYPQFTFWHNLKIAASEINTINRYQHLTFKLDGTQDNPFGYLVHSPALDAVQITLDATRFDFSTTGAEVLTAPEKHLNALKSNAQLHHLGNHQGWSWYAVKSSAIAKPSDLKGLNVVR